jgi:hypothetical protein
MRALVDEMISTNRFPEYARYYLEQSRIDRQFDWKQPIDFYGKVIDEKGQPVAGALAGLSWNDLSKEGTSETKILSDTNGLFALEERQGKVLSVSVSKEGYYRPPIGWMKSFEYANPFEPHFHRPDPSNLVTFHLRKKGQATNLVTSQFGVYPSFSPPVPADGTPVLVDLLNRKCGANGHLEVSQVKPPYLQWKDATSWSFRMAIPDGGFVEHRDEFPFEAPKTGYQPAVQFEFQKGEINWVHRVEKRFYIRFGNPPLYGRLDVETRISSTNARLTYVINPSGSRNLEHDPNAGAKPAFYE